MPQETHQFDIQLREVSFFAYHGLYPEEKRKGTRFQVDLSVNFDHPSGKIIHTIQESVNYVRLYEIVKEEMDHPRDLLETVSMQISEKIKATFPAVNEIAVTITKLNPPIEDFSGKVSVTYTYKINKHL